MTVSSDGTDTTVLHPLVDGQGPLWVATETRAEVVALTSALSDFLTRAVGARLRPLLVTGQFSRLTQATSEALASVRGVWVVRAVDGSLHDGRTGAALRGIADAAVSHRLSSSDDLAAAFVRSPLVSEMTLRFTVSTRHRVTRTPLLGGPMESLAQRFTGAPPAAWGATEPLVAAWDRTQVTEYTRRRMPDQSRWAVRGTPAAPFSGTIVTTRTSIGLEETTHAWVSRGLPGGDGVASMADDAFDALRDLRGHGMPLMAVAVAQPGPADLTVQTGLTVPPVPLALFIGAPGIRQLQVPVNAWLDRFDATVIGSPRVPAVLFRLGNTDDDGWATVGEILRAIDADVLESALIPSDVVRAALRKDDDA